MKNLEIVTKYVYGTTYVLHYVKWSRAKYGPRKFLFSASQISFS